jgi:hypothetical protein
LGGKRLAENLLKPTRQIQLGLWCDLWVLTPLPGLAQFWPRSILARVDFRLGWIFGPDRFWLGSIFG